MELTISTPHKVNLIPRVPKAVLRRIPSSDNPFVADANGMIGRLNALSAVLPSRYGWRYRTSDGFKAEMAEIADAATDALPMNSLYWRDQLSNWAAYSLMNTLRVIDLARSCVWALAREEALCASLLARSALETAAAFVDAARTMSATIRATGTEQDPGSILDPSVDLRTTVVVSTELEHYSLKTIFASRLPESEGIYEATNILTIITRISKIRTAEFLLPTYGVLSEVAHPNLLGRTLYLHGSEPGPWEGNEVRTLGPGNGLTWQFLAEPIVAALSWACATQESAFSLMGETIDEVIARLRMAEQTPIR